MSDEYSELETLKRENSMLKERIFSLELELKKSEDYEQRILDMSKNMKALRGHKSKYRTLAYLLRMMCDNVPDMIWAKDINNNYIFANKAICKNLLNAVDTEEPIGKNDIFFAERERNSHKNETEWHTFGEICRDTDVITMEAGSAQQFDEYGNIQGKFLFLDVCKAPFIDEKGKLIGTVGSARDVTSAKETEQLIKNSEQKLALAMELANLVYWEYDINTRHFILDDRFYQLYATSTELEGGSNLLPKEYLQRFVHPEDQAKLEKALKKAMQPFSNVNIIQVDYRIIRRDGEIRHIHTQAWLNRDTENRTHKIYGANQDITERKKVEEALANSNYLLQTIINTSPVRVFWKDVNLRYLGSNPAFSKDAGVSNPDEMIGKDDFQFSWRDHAEQYRADDTQVLSSGKPKLFFEEQQVAPDGTQMWLRTSKVPLRNNKNEIVGLLGIYEDITEQKLAKSEKDRLESQNQQFQKSESLGRMAGAISHHFNNRLQAVIGNLELAIQDLPDGSEAMSSITTAISECDKAAEISSMMLAYLGQTPSKFQPVDLSEISRKCIPMLQAAVGRKTILGTAFPTHGPTINANDNQIQQVLFNVVVNAWEASSPYNQAININITTVTPEQIPNEQIFPVDWQPQKNNYACLEIRDTGHGISELEINKIFDPFFSSRFTGRGMGLSVALGIIKTHRGAISVESKTGVGSTFKIFVPVLN